MWTRSHLTRRPGWIPVESKAADSLVTQNKTSHQDEQQKYRPPLRTRFDGLVLQMCNTCVWFGEYTMTVLKTTGWTALGPQRMNPNHDFWDPLSFPIAGWHLRLFCGLKWHVSMNDCKEKDIQTSTALYFGLWPKTCKLIRLEIIPLCWRCNMS